MTKAFFNNCFIQIARNIYPGVLFVALFLGACKNDLKDINNALNKGPMQEDVAEDVTIYFSEMGEVKVELYAKKFIRNDAANPPYTDMKDGLKVLFFDDSLNVDNTLTARYGRYYHTLENVILKDSVVVINKKGERLDTDELIWNQKLKLFFTEKPVAITTATQTIFGNGLDANQDFSWYQIRNIKGFLKVDKEKLPE